MKMSTRDMILVAMFTALTAIGAFIKIPIMPAPITLQFLFTALAGVMLGSRLGALSQIVYVVLGLIGIPIFTGGGGIAYIFKPTFGYLLGFIVASYVIGKISESSKSYGFIKYFSACILGLAIIYIIGVPYLYLVLKYIVGTKITIYSAIKTGFLVFIPGDISKAIVTSILAYKIVPSISKSLLA